MLVKEEVQIIRRPMIHYFEVLAKVSADQGLPAATKEDLLNEFTSLVRAQDELGITTSNNTPYLTRLDDPNYNRVISSALKCYIEDLETSKLKIKELYDDAIPLTSTHRDFELAGETLKKIPVTA